MRRGYSMRVQARWAQVKRETQRKLRQVVDKAAFDVEGLAKAAIQTGPKTGRVYERGEHDISFKTKAGVDVVFTANKGKAASTHQASAPGEAPATDTGNLVNSIFTVSELGPVIRSTVNVAAEYGWVLEYGGGRVAARPFLGPAVEAVKPAFEAAIVAAMREVQ